MKRKILATLAMVSLLALTACGGASSSQGFNLKLDGNSYDLTQDAETVTRDMAKNGVYVTRTGMDHLTAEGEWSKDMSADRSVFVMYQEGEGKGYSVHNYRIDWINTFSTKDGIKNDSTIKDLQKLKGFYKCEDSTFGETKLVSYGAVRVDGQYVDFADYESYKVEDYISEMGNDDKVFYRFDGTAFEQNTELPQIENTMLVQRMLPTDRSDAAKFEPVAKEVIVNQATFRPALYEALYKLEQGEAHTVEVIYYQNDDLTTQENGMSVNYYVVTKADGE